MGSTFQDKPGLWTEWRGWPYVIVGLTALLRLAHIWNSRGNPTFWVPAVDPAWYDQAAQNILQGDWGPFPLFRAPVYQTLLAAVYAIFGHDLFAARVLSVALQSVTVWAIWRTGKAYFSSLVGVVAGMLFALNGMTIYFACEMVPTSAEMLVAALAVWSTFSLFRDRTLAATILCGIAWGFAAITRPNFLFVLPVALAVIAFRSTASPGENRLRNKLAAAAMLLIAAMIPILPVTLANWLKSGEPVLIATQGGVNFWIGNNPEATGILSSLPGYGNTWTMEDAQDAAEQEVGHPLKSGEISTFYYHKGWTFLQAHPAEAIRFMIRKTALFFNRFEISNNKHIVHFSALTPWLPPLIYLDFGILIPLSLLGLWVLWIKPETKVLLGLILIYAASVILFFITSRFRMPVVPWMCLLAAGGMDFIQQLIRNQQVKRAWLPLMILIPGTVLAWMNPWNLNEAPVGWARYMEGNAYLHLNQLDSSRVCFEDALRDRQAVPRCELNLGVVAFRQGDTLAAEKWYLASVRSDSGFPDAWNNLGTIYESLGDTSGAMNAYGRALLLKPWAPDPRHNLAGIHFRIGIAALKQGQDSIAIHHLEACLHFEQNAAAHFDLALAFSKLGDTDTALSHVNQALVLDPGMAVAYQLRAKLQATKEAPAGGAAP